MTSRHQAPRVRPPLTEEQTLRLRIALLQSAARACRKQVRYRGLVGVIHAERRRLEALLDGQAQLPATVTTLPL